ncbi:hypothetical protein ACSQ6I_22735 [Anabaena sp. WFMT]|uniref:hypothetical protein n=1 Tax=Anabaena sp. WFMT TaxID=3449730 RepID=UPI003F20C723
MNHIDPDSITLENPNTVAQSEDSSDTPQRLLPRLAWDSQITYLRLLFRAKKALDRIEKEACISRI